MRFKNSSHMKKKIEVKICTGTLCYVMGGADLQVIDEYLPAELLDLVELKGAPCLEHCNNPLKESKAPYVEVDGEVISDATVLKVVNAIKKVLEKDK